MPQPKLIFLDAVGTLFGVRDSVGEVYRQLALAEGVELDADALETAFRQSFGAATAPVFPGVDTATIPQREYQWWEAIAFSTFEMVGALSKFSDFRAFFGRVYDHFATAKPWYIYDDVIPALQAWQAAGIELAIVSNFDTRIYRVLELLELKSFFQSITIASLASSAKPDREIFLKALEKHQYIPQETWHIGDSFREDYQGAKTIGIKPFLLQRSSTTKFDRDRVNILTRLGSS